MMENPVFSNQANTISTKLFTRMMNSGWWHHLWAKVTRHTDRLMELDREMAAEMLNNSHYGGVRPVSISKIRGTEGKADAFDNEFHPLTEKTKGRWLSIALEKLRGRDLPPVELLDVDGTYYVRDGHHRISVARCLGEKYIDAEIIVVNMSRPWM